MIEDVFHDRREKNRRATEVGEALRRDYEQVQHGPEYADFREAVPKMLAEHRTPAQRRAKFKVVK